MSSLKSGTDWYLQSLAVTIQPFLNIWMKTTGTTFFATISDCGVAGSLFFTSPYCSAVLKCRISPTSNPNNVGYCSFGCDTRDVDQLHSVPRHLFSSPENSQLEQTAGISLRALHQILFFKILSCWFLDCLDSLCGQSCFDKRKSI